MTQQSQPRNEVLIRVAILEDGRYVRQGMEVALQSHDDIQLVAATPHPGEVIDRVKNGDIDVAIIDLKIQDDIAVGSNTIKEIKEIAPDLTCIVFTAFPELPNFLAAFDAGADAFVSKDASEQEPALPELIRRVAAGGKYYDPSVVAEMRHYIKRSPVTVPDSEQQNPFTDREKEVLELLVDGLRNAAIARKLVISENTVKAHLRNMAAKLGVSTRQEIVLIAISRGWANRPT